MRHFSMRGKRGVVFAGLVESDAIRERRVLQDVESGNRRPRRQQPKC